MNAKTLIAAAALVVAASGAFAVESEQFNPAQSTLSRADVKAGARSALAVSYGEATVFADTPAASTESRENVRAQARAAARHPTFNELYAG